MSIASEITRLQNAKASLKTSINAKTDSNHQITNETLEDYSTFVDSISGGSSFKITDAQYLFYNGARLNVVSDMLDLISENVTNMNYMFASSYSLTSVDLSSLRTSKLGFMGSTFYFCTSLSSLDLSNFDTSKLTYMAYAFAYCRALTNLNLGNNFNTSKVTSMEYTFSNCTNLTQLPEIDASSCTSIAYVLQADSALTTFGGFKDLGKAYSTSNSANYSYYKLDLSGCTALTEQSLINVLNNLYDIATKGCRAQSCVLGSTNLGKLTSSAGQQALSNAQTKGWNIS